MCLVLLVINDACYIASIFGQTSANGIQVLVDSNNKLGTSTSSKRFKKEIKPMDKVSEAILHSGRSRSNTRAIQKTRRNLA